MNQRGAQRLRILRIIGKVDKRMPRRLERRINRYRKNTQFIEA
jgi:hypothetical protein